MDIKDATRKAALELYEKAGLKDGQVVMVGCSTSEVAGHHIGTHSKAEIGAEIFNELNIVFSERNVGLAAQCCEHLNRAVIVERKYAAGFNIVNAVPVPEAGGAFAAAAFKGFNDPVALEAYQADAGIDIGGTLIGMHLKPVAVPLRLDVRLIGEAIVIAARTRPPLIGGSRTIYDGNLL